MYALESVICYLKIFPLSATPLNDSSIASLVSPEFSQQFFPAAFPWLGNEAALEEDRRMTKQNDPSSNLFLNGHHFALP